jgi:four helix bundle suffix protein
VAEEREWTNTDEHGQARTEDTQETQNADSRQYSSESVAVRDSPCQSTSQALPSAALAANAVLSIINLACYLLDRQIAAQAEAFEKEGGFTERLYRTRTARRRKD